MSKSQEIRRGFESAIDEADAHAAANPDDGFARGYLMGLCLGAALAGQPEDVWASPERHNRQQRAREEGTA